MASPLSLRTRLRTIRISALALMAATGPVLRAQNPFPANDGFNPNPNSFVTALALQPDGKILMGGYFTQVQPPGGTGGAYGHIARINHDGSVDQIFNPNTNDVVRTITLQSNGQILIGGQFTTVQPSGGGAPVTRNYAARLNTDGSLDTVFNPNANGVVYAFAVQPNGQIIIGGSFTSVQPAGAASPTTRNHIARFNTDGSLDTSFDPNTDRPVLSLAVEPNGQIILGGGFSRLQPNGASVATTRNCIARVNSDGSLDTGFDPEASGSVMTILILPNGQIVVGGQFISFQPNGAITPIQIDSLARLNTDGTVDETFIVNPLGTVYTVALQGDGSLVIGGDFTLINPIGTSSPIRMNYAARITAQGSVDATYNPNPDQDVNAIVIEQDGSAILGGYFIQFLPFDLSSAISRNFIARVGPEGTVDSTLAPDANGGVFASATTSTGQFYIGGTFQSINGTSQSYLARLNANGTLDTTFAPTLNGPVQAIALQSNGQILVGGIFTVVDGIPRNNMVRLNTDGTVDGPFNPSPSGRVVMISPQASGQIFIGGDFGDLSPNGVVTPVNIGFLARLNNDGSVDETFTPNPGGAVYSLAVDSNGKLVVGGSFTSIANTGTSYVARLLTTGAIDTSNFNPQPNGPVYAISIQTNGDIVIGGGFTSVEPQTAKTGTPVNGTDMGTNTTLTTPYGVAVTIPQPGYSATQPIYINYMARLNTDGTLDTTFFPDPSYTVLAITPEASGSMIVAGSMTSFAPNGNTVGTIRNYIGLVNSDGSLDPNFNPNANGQVDVLSPLSGGQILIGGTFTTLQPNGASAPSPETHVAIINANGTIDTAFAADVTATPTGQVNAMALLPTGQLLLGGSFGAFGGSTGSNLARFDPDGGPDPTYNPVFDGPVNAIDVQPNGSSISEPSSYALWLESTGTVRYPFSAASGSVSVVVQQANGQVLVGGSFTGFQGTTSTGFQNLVRLNTDGTLDTTFQPAPNGQVTAIVIQPNGQIIIGGNFTEVGTTNYNYLARLNVDGSVDTSFNPSPDLGVTCLALQANGQVIAGGYFLDVETDEASQTATATTTTTTTSTAVAASYIARFNSDGTQDTTFNPDLSSYPSTIVVLGSGQILIGGTFTAITPNGGSGTVVIRNGIARLNSDGSVDAAFNPSCAGLVASIAVMPNGQLYVGGSFSGFQPNVTYTTTNGVTTANGTIYSVNNLARLNTDGTVDTTFNPDPNASVASLALQANGQIVVGGEFTDFNTNGAAVAIPRDYIARLNPGGTVDTSFDPALNSNVSTVVVLLDGSVFVGGTFTAVETGGAILVGGSFANVNGTPAPYLARLNADSTVNSTFTSNTDGPVNALVPQPDGKTLVGGSFAHIAGQAFPNLARLNADTSLDTSFVSGPNGPVNAIVVWPNGEILVGGSFSSVGGQPASNLALLGSSGSPVASFAPVVNGTVDAAVALPSGQIVIGGAFTSVDGVVVGGIARLNADGTIDSTFNPEANGAVEAVTLQVDGTLLVAGAFTSIGGAPISYAARLLPGGAVDTTFNPSPNGVVNAVLAQADGKVVIGGSFTVAGGQTRYDIARFSTTQLITQALTVSSDESTITWTRAGGVPAFASAMFEESTDGTHFTSLGNATSADGMTWQLTGLPSNGTGTFYVRATGVTPSSRYGSSGLLQYIALIDIQADPSISSSSQTTGIEGASFSFTVTSTQSPASYSASGLPAGLSINPATGVISGTPTAGGTFNVAVTATSFGASSTSILSISIASQGSSPSLSTASGNRIVNLSSRDNLIGSQAMIAGFVISGTGQKELVLRAVGPGLAAFGVSGVMATPQLQLFSSSGSLVAQNSGWGGTTALATAFAQVGAFALAPSSADAALEVSLEPGAYTMQVSDPTGKGGVVLTEIYDASPSPLSAAQQLINISARGTVSPGAGALIGGFVVSGGSTRTVLIRGVGPGLAAYGVTGILPDPVLSVYDSNGNLVAQNTAWGNQTPGGPDQVGGADIVSTDASVGAFALTVGSADTALVANLPPGAYTFEVTSASNSTGQALGEVYEVP